MRSGAGRAFGFAGLIRFDRRPVDEADLGALAGGLGISGATGPKRAKLEDAGFAWVPGQLPEERFDTPAAQPLGGAIVLLDGRLDNRAELADGLALDPALTSDLGLVTAAWRRWGDDLAGRLIGDFALAVWDADRRRLLLASDPGGLRPLYFIRHGAAAAFATSLRPIFALPGIPRELDEAAVADLLALNHQSGGGTLWHGVERVPGAATVVLDQDAIYRREGWSPLAAPPVRFRRDAEYVEAARALLDRAVSDRLRIAGPAVVMASGGLDSAAVATTAARLSRSTVHLLTAAPDEAAPVLRRRHRYADERPYVQALAAMHPGLSLEVIACSTPDMLHQDGTALFLGTQAPVGPDGALGWFEPVFRRAAALGATVLLTGDMGEQSLSNSGIFRLRQLFLQGRWLALAHELRRLQDPSPGGALTYFRGHVLSTFVPPALRAARHRATGRGLFGNWHAYAALRPEIAARHGLSARMVANGFPGGDIGQYKGVAPLADWLLKRQRFVSGYAGAVRAMHGLALSQPLGDRRLIEFCAGLPADQFLRDGVPRRLIRQVLADRAPASIADNPCKGEQNPEWFHRLSQRREEIAGELDRLAASPLAARILDLPRLKALLDDWPADAEAAARRGPAYSGMLPRALHVGQFLRWVEGGNG